MDRDEVIIKRVLSGDINSFNIIVDGYKKYVFAIINNIIRDQQETENIAQETFIQAYSSLDKYQFRGFKTWLGRIATNKAIDYLRKKEKEKTISLERIDEKSLSMGNCLEDAIIQREEAAYIKEVCNGIPDKYSNVLKKYYIGALNCRRIAEEEGVSIKTVESRLYRAKSLLKAKWKEGG